MKNNRLDFFTVSSLEKVFPNKKPHNRYNSYSILKNERFSFQVVCYSDVQLNNVNIEVESDISNEILVRRVVCVPSVLALKHNNHDSYIINKKNFSIMYPDVLFEMEDAQKISQGIWTSFWITINNDERLLTTGLHKIRIHLTDTNKKILRTCEFNLDVINEVLVDADLKLTNWIHYDCIANYYNVEPFTTEYYKYLNMFINSQVKHGITMLYTPLFTPPLDTEVGNERRTTQLVDVFIKEGKYQFGFSKLDKFIKNALNLGIKYFELSHIVTQWGGSSCPKIVANCEGKIVNIFGWDNKSNSKEYIEFLKLFLESLYEYLYENKYLDIVYFHISDEPHLEDIDNIRLVKSIYDEVFASKTNIKIMDALAEKEYYKENIINTPVVATSSFDKFTFDSNTEKWVYYCSWQKNNNLSNRFFNMPAQRNRILGFQLYQNEIKGFLHWGYNFYNTECSLHSINPYFVTDAGGAFESGDSFMVYPAEHNVRESIRNEVFFEGLNDYRAMKVVELKYGKDFAMKLLSRQRLSGFTKYKKSANWHLHFRKKINDIINGFNSY